MVAYQLAYAPRHRLEEVLLAGANWAVYTLSARTLEPSLVFGEALHLDAGFVASSWTYSELNAAPMCPVMRACTPSKPV